MRIALLAAWLLLSCAPLSRADSAEVPDPEPSALALALDVTIVTTVSVEALKRTFQEPRPVGSGYSGYAFPSGHATLAFALAPVAATYDSKRRTLWYAVAAGVAWSRVHERAHDWDDVIAGAALGTLIGRSAVRHGGIVLVDAKW